MNSRPKIDLNADIGEGMPYDGELIRYISSCNIASGGHFGDEMSISETIKLAKNHRVKVGAHPSYPDKKYFGRQSMDISDQDLIKSIDDQLSDFKSNCNELNVNWHHIKFHGALYNDLKSDEEKAVALTKLIKKKYPDIVLYVPPNSIVKRIAQDCDVKVCVEGFADRAYNEDLSLVSRGLPGAVLLKAEDVIEQVENLVLFQRVKTISGTYQPVNVQTICLHGDTPTALELTKASVNVLIKNNVLIQ